MRILILFLILFAVGCKKDEDTLNGSYTSNSNDGRGHYAVGNITISGSKMNVSCGVNFQNLNIIPDGENFTLQGFQGNARAGHGSVSGNKLTMVMVVDYSTGTDNWSFTGSK